MHQGPYAEADDTCAAVLDRARLGRLDAVLMSRLLQLGCGPPDLMAASLRGPKSRQGSVRVLMLATNRLPQRAIAARLRPSKYTVGDILARARIRA